MVVWAYLRSYIKDSRKPVFTPGSGLCFHSSQQPNSFGDNCICRSFHQSPSVPHCVDNPEAKKNNEEEGIYVLAFNQSHQHVAVHIQHDPNTPSWREQCIGGYFRADLKIAPNT